MMFEIFVVCVIFVFVCCVIDVNDMMWCCCVCVMCCDVDVFCFVVIGCVLWVIVLV